MEFVNRVIHALTELHPTHPMLVHFPIALTSAAFLFILLAYWRKNSSLEPAALANIVLAIILFILTAGISIVRYRNPDLFQKGHRFLYIASYGVSFATARVLAFLGRVILYGF